MPLTIYSAHDVWEAYASGKRAKLLVLQQEQEIIEAADLVFFTSRANFQRKAPLNRNAHYLPHGCPTPPADILLAHDRRSRPSDFPVKGSVFLGYWGVLSRKVVDLALIDWLARRHPEWTFLFIGPVYKPDRRLFENLAARGNVVLLGPKKPTEMFEYLCGLHVGLLCHPRTDMKVQSSPLKVWDYMSAGLPVVSIPIPEIESLSEFVHFADDPEQWEEMIGKAAMENTSERKRRRVDFAQTNSWDKRVHEISKIISGHVVRRK